MQWEVQRAVHDLYRALREDRSSAAASLFAAEGVHSVYAICRGGPSSGDHRGRAAITAQFRNFCSQWEIVDHTVNELSLDAHSAFARVTVRSVNRQDGSEVATDETHVFHHSVTGFVRLDTFVEAARGADAERARQPCEAVITPLPTGAPMR